MPPRVIESGEKLKSEVRLISDFSGGGFGEYSTWSEDRLGQNFRQQKQIDLT